jgi:superfamily II DNA or RNA helicase
MYEIDTILDGPYWKEKVRVITSRQISDDMIKLEAVGVETDKYYSQIISGRDLDKIKIEEETDLKFSGEGEGFFLYIESHRIRNAFQFDPLYAVNVSQVDPLPHQIDAVYYHVLQNPRVRYLLADDPGAGKTIMAGLIIKELKYRGLVDKILIVAPGHLKYQWMREMKEKFQEQFRIVDRTSMDLSWGQNVFEEEDQLITSIDFAKQEDVMASLKDSKWDLVIVDEAHKMSAYKYGNKTNKTGRYRLGELVSEISNYMIMLTATPHRGDDENFRLFLDLLEPGFFANTEMLKQSIKDKDNPLFLRRLKEDMKDFDSTPLFPPRHVHTKKFKLSEDEKELYNAVTEYVQEHFNKATQKEKRNVVFAMIILQRRLASSVRAVRTSLERRRKRLQDLYDKAELFDAGEYKVDRYLDDMSEDERWKQEEELLTRLTSADNMDELKFEIDALIRLVTLAKEVEKKEVESKLTELRTVMEERGLKKSRQKLLIFTESRDTLNYLIEKLKLWGYATTEIHGLMKMDARIAAENDFRNEAQICVATEAAGEGINLQFCSMMVNYDIPWNPNRLEQRMGRIHRYGQQKEVYIYNLVARDTREGKILTRLFEKLDRMREQMGSDRVFDVIGEIWEGDKSLKDLIMEAVTEQRTMDEILSGFERVEDTEAINRVKTATMETLSTRHIDLHRIMGEQRQAKENRLVPEYVKAYFERAAKVWDIQMEKRKDGFIRIPSVPFEIRNQPKSFKNKYGEIVTKYAKISFNKHKAFKGNGEFVAMGHPLLEGVVDENLKKFTDAARKGAIFVDPDSEKDGVLWIYQAEYRDGSNLPAGRRLFCIYQNKKQELQLVSPGIFWDLKPMPTRSKAEAIQNLDQDKITTFVLTNGLEKYREELIERRQRDADIKEKYGIRSLNTLIAKSEEKLADYATKRMLGETVVAATEQREQKKRDDLEKKRLRLQDQIRAETHLLPSEPKLLGVARVIPKSLDTVTLDRQHSNKEIEMVGMRVTEEYERVNNRTPEDVSAENVGYDIKSTNKNEVRYIEVKARAQTGAIDLTPNEWMIAQRLREEYWLYIVEYAGTNNPRLYTIQDPAKKLSPERIVEAYRWRSDDWKEAAKGAK